MHWRSSHRILVAFVAVAMPCFTDAESPASNAWITGAANDEERFARVEQYLRGFDQPTWEVGERYERIHGALARGNLSPAC